jgi:hypothetical protein
MSTVTVPDGATLAQHEARLAGMSRAVTALCGEVERLAAQTASDHAFIRHMADLFYTIATHEGSQQKIMGLLRQDGIAPDPLSQQVRALTHQKLVPVYSTRDPKPLPPIDHPAPGTAWWDVLNVLGKIANDTEEPE